MTASSKTGTQENLMLSSVFAVLSYTAGIYFCYIFYGIAQENIYHQTFDGKKFTSSLFLVWVQCLAHLLLAAVMRRPDPSTKPAPMMAYVKIGFSYVGAMYATNYSLNFINFPTQALGKSCKLVPVMLSRIIINKKRYALSEYLCVLLITIGISIFQLGKSTKDMGSNSTFGLVLLAVSLALDAYTGPAQEACQKQYNMSESEMMFQMNKFAIAFVSIGMLAADQLLPALTFIVAHPSLLPSIAAFALLSATGQAVLLRALFRFDSLVVTTITTTRKFVTILASVLWFGHTLASTQWMGVVLVFSGLAGDIYVKNNKSKAKVM